MNFVNGGGGGSKSLKVLKVEESHYLARLGHISIKIMLIINRERSERRKWGKNSAMGIKNHRSAAVRGEAPGAPPWNR